MRGRGHHRPLDPWPVELTRPIPFTALEVAILEDALRVYAAMAKHAVNGVDPAEVSRLAVRIHGLVDHEPVSA